MQALTLHIHRPELCGAAGWVPVLWWRNAGRAGARLAHGAAACFLQGAQTRGAAPVCLSGLG